MKISMKVKKNILYLNKYLIFTMITEQNNQMLKCGINWILLDDTFKDKTLTTKDFDGKFAPGSMLLVPASSTSSDYYDYKLYFVDLNKKIHKVS